MSHCRKCGTKQTTYEKTSCFLSLVTVAGLARTIGEGRMVGLDDPVGFSNLSDSMILSSLYHYFHDIADVVQD